MNTDSESMTFEEQFAAFSGQVPQWDQAGDQPAVTLAPDPEPVQEPELGPVEPVPPAEPVAPLEPFTPVAPAAVEPVAPAPEPVLPAAFADEPSTDFLLAELEKATESLAAFRQELGRVVGQQRTTEAELATARGQLARLEGQVRDSDEYARLESELGRQRQLVATVRAKLGELFTSLDAS